MKEAFYKFVKKWQLIDMHRSNIRKYCKLFDGLSCRDVEGHKFLAHLMACDNRAIKRIKRL